MSLDVLTAGPVFKAARWTDEGLVYVAETEAGVVRPNGARFTVLNPSEGETLVPTIDPSPDGRYVVIYGTASDDHGLRWNKAYVIDLEALP
ncbi:MAG: hypothetical protein ACYC41_14410 [Bacillota bacterium]